jgi:hypothetical protein
MTRGATTQLGCTRTAPGCDRIHTWATAGAGVAGRTLASRPAQAQSAVQERRRPTSSVIAAWRRLSAVAEEQRRRTWRRSRGFLVAGAIIVVVGIAIAVIVTIAPATTENFSSAGSAGRVQIPGTSSVELQAQQYSFWYGVFTYGDLWPGTPAMTITIDPPTRAPTPGFSWNDGGGEIDSSNPQNLTLELVAYVHPKVAGVYRISVKSQEGGAGVILIGKTLASAAPEVIPGLCVFGATVVIAGAVVLVGYRRRDRADT